MPAVRFDDVSDASDVEVTLLVQRFMCPIVFGADAFQCLLFFNRETGIASFGTQLFAGLEQAVVLFLLGQSQ